MFFSGNDFVLSSVSVANAYWYVTVEGAHHYILVLQNVSNFKNFKILAIIQGNVHSIWHYTK